MTSPLSIKAIKTEMSEEEDHPPNYSNVCEEKEDINKSAPVFYGVNDVPPVFTSLVCGFQHYLMMFGGTLAVPYILSDAICLVPDDPNRGRLVSTIFFVSGLVTLIQSSVGVRLPIIQGGTFTFLVPTFAILSLEKWRCPPIEDIYRMDQDGRAELWQSRMRELQGAVISAGIMQMLLGYTGLIGLLVRYITPLAITPTIALIGLSLAGKATEVAGKHWGISALTFVLFTLFCQYLVNIEIPLLSWSRKKGFTKSKYPMFRLFSVALSMGITWIICAIMTSCGILSSDSAVRTDTKLNVIYNTPWIQFPYPFQFGLPTFSSEAVVGMFAAVLASAVESVGDYYACARLGGAHPPPAHAINRGIGTEGLGCIIAGIFGTGNGTTSYSQNVGAIGILKIGSRRVVQYSALFMILFSLISKFGSFFITMPEPILGGFFFVLFGMVASVGLATLQYVDLNSSRNLFVLGVSLLIGIGIPEWIAKNPHAVDTGVDTLNQIITVLLTTSMFLGGLCGFVLDNTIPGGLDERGVTKWMEHITKKEELEEGENSCYDFPIGMTLIKRFSWTRYIPFFPTYEQPDMSGKFNKAFTCFKKSSSKVAPSEC